MHPTLVILFLVFFVAQFSQKKLTLYPNCPYNCPLLIKNFLVFTRGGNYMEFSWIFTFFDCRHFQMSLSELKLYFITYYRPLVYFEVFSIYLSVFYEFMWSPQKKQKENFFGFFGFFIFFSLFSWGDRQLYGQFGYVTKGAIQTAVALKINTSVQELNLLLV